MLLSFAEAGATVVRLKGGDPLVSFLQYDHQFDNVMLEMPHSLSKKDDGMC